MIRLDGQTAFPMLAAAMPKKPLIMTPGQWVAEQKYDGHRILVEVRGGVAAGWSRLGKYRQLPHHLCEAFRNVADGIYDGELFVPGGKAYGVKELTNSAELVYVAFDILQVGAETLIDFPYWERRKRLGEIIKNQESGSYFSALSTSPMWAVSSEREVDHILRQVWDRDGEGLILKDISMPYTPGKRPKNSWVKIKKKQSAVLTVIGFQPSRGEIVVRGPHAIVVLKDDEGNITTVKTKNDLELAKFDQQTPGFMEQHPAIGRKLRIEFQERTADNSYREPRWDRWEDE